MNIKHWQGYGTVSAVKVPDCTCNLHIKVTGDHEYGLERDNAYDLINWLIVKFDKSVKALEGREKIDFERYLKYEIEEVEWNEVHYKFHYYGKKNSWGW